MCPDNLERDAIYALYPKSFCGKNLAIRKVFVFFDSVCRYRAALAAKTRTMKSNAKQLEIATKKIILLTGMLFLEPQRKNRRPPASGLIIFTMLSHDVKKQQHWGHIK